MGGRESMAHTPQDSSQQPLDGASGSSRENGGPAKPERLARVPSDFVDKIREHLRVLNWTQQQLADAAGVSRAIVSGWIGKKDRSIGRDDVCRLAWAVAGGLDEAILESPKPDRTLGKRG